MSWYSKSVDEIKKELNTDLTKGLDRNEALKRLSKYGRNIIEGKKPPGIIYKFFSQFQDFMIIILLLAAGISFVTSLLRGDADYIDPIIILVIVVFNAIIGVVQESKAEKSIEALKKISAPTSLVRRDGQTLTVPAEELVPGDIVILKTGNRISADCRLINSVGLFADESMLTGESMPVGKSADYISSAYAPLADRKNMVWAGSMVTAGKGEGIVCRTGMNTEMGSIASMIISADIRKTPLSEKLDGISKNLGWAALFICSVIFVIGLFRNIPPFEMFMTAVSLAVAAIPEGLPAIVTIMLALGVRRMAKLGAITRNLPSVETLGCASVICSDKTGTLTENKMKVVKAFADSEKNLYRFASVCSDSDSMNPTEIAILEAAERFGFTKEVLEQRYKKLSEIPFNSEKKRMSVLVNDSGTTVSVTKGAPDIILKKCSYIDENNIAKPLSEAMRREIFEKNREMAENALRVIAVAYKKSDTISEENLVFVGLIGIEDPPRKEVKDAVDICRRAGITPVMITGDHVATAKAIAKKTGIFIDGSKVMTGDELERTSQAELEKNIEKYSVFARVTPNHKVRIVKAWQKKQAVVAMTGDGVNDAPALKTADIGCSMGISGTDVAKNASDMILTDDNFATIIKAVKQGRGIYANIKKAVHFLLSGNIGEIVTVFTALLLGWQTPLLAVHLLWINLVTDSLPAIALGVDPPSGDLMTEKPRQADKGIFADGMWLTIILEGVIIGILAIIGFLYGNITCSLTVGRTMAFSILSISQLIHAFNVRSNFSVFSSNVFSNKYLLGAFLTGLVLQCSVISLPVIATVFKVTPLSVKQWFIVTALSLTLLVICEIQKLVSNLFNN